MKKEEISFQQSAFSPVHHRVSSALIADR